VLGGWDGRTMISNAYASPMRPSVIGSKPNWPTDWIEIKNPDAPAATRVIEC
jgi:hypothetical protein